MLRFAAPVGCPPPARRANGAFAALAKSRRIRQSECLAGGVRSALRQVHPNRWCASHGNVDYQVCKPDLCLPPDTFRFNVELPVER